MKTSIKAVVANNWQVETHKWFEDSAVSWWQIPVLLDRAQRQGKRLGETIVWLGQVTQNDGYYKHVHLIGHSAGGALIQAASEAIKWAKPATVVHTTFLDAFAGITAAGRSQYGKGSDWSDSYFAIDAETFGKTDGRLDNAYNVDVTWCDLNHGWGSVNCSSDLIVGTCQQAISTHGWPYRFYQVTIPPVTRSDLEGFGFPVSKEGGNWDFATSTYHKEDPTHILGGSTVDIPPIATPIYTGPKLTISGSDALPYLKSDTGTIQLNGYGLTLQSQAPSLAPQAATTKNALAIGSSAAASDFGAPAWLSIGVILTNAANFVTLDAQFTSATGAAGLLTVY